MKIREIQCTRRTCYASAGLKGRGGDKEPRNESGL